MVAKAGGTPRQMASSTVARSLGLRSPRPRASASKRRAVTATGAARFAPRFADLH